MRDLDEKVDVYSFANNIYCLVSGAWNSHAVCSHASIPDPKLYSSSIATNFFDLPPKLTGLWPFYENEDDAVVQDMVSSGKRPYVDPRYPNRSHEERWLVHVMERGWEQNATFRIDIFEMVRMLRKAIHEIQEAHPMLQ
jgi:hypothetical protein